MEQSRIPQYEVDARWRIVRVNDAFCRLFRGTEAGLIGRDVRELLRGDFRRDFVRYVARVLVGLGEVEATVPMVAPCGRQTWLKHRIEKVLEEATLIGYRASLQLQNAPAARPHRRWWTWRAATPHLVWDTELDGLAKAS